MGVTFFDLKPKKKKELKKEPKIERFALIKREIPGTPSSMTYIDIDGKEKNVTGDFHKLSNGSYIMNNISVEYYPIYETQDVSYVYTSRKFSYLDKDGIKREFNDYDSLKYDESTNSYAGLVSDIEYISTPIEVFIDETNKNLEYKND